MADLARGGSVTPMGLPPLVCAEVTNLTPQVSEHDKVTPQNR